MQRTLSRTRSTLLAITLIAGMLLLAWSGHLAPGVVFAADPPPPAAAPPTDPAPAPTTGSAPAPASDPAPAPTTGSGPAPATDPAPAPTTGSAPAPTTGSGATTTGGTAPPAGGTTTTGGTAPPAGGTTTTGGTVPAGGTTATGGPAPAGGTTATGGITAPAGGTTPPGGGTTTANTLSSNSGTPTQDGGAAGAANLTAPAAPASSGTGSSTTGGASASTGDALAVGNISETVIQQLVFLFANINMPGVNASDLTGPLISINQTANVSNSGTATATSGSSNALIDFIASLSGAGGAFTSQVSANASASSGNATSVGNMSYTDITQIASVMVTLNGDSSISDQLLSIIQSAGVSNSGSATATSGNATAAVTVTTGSAVTPPADDSASSSSSDDSSSDDSNQKKLYNKQLMWGEAPAKNVVVLLYVDGRSCKQADTEADPDRKDSFVWYAYVSLGECGAKPGSSVTYAIAVPVKQSTKWDNTRANSPEIRIKELMAIKAIYLEK